MCGERFPFTSNRIRGVCLVILLTVSGTVLGVLWEGRDWGPKPALTPLTWSGRESVAVRRHKCQACVSRTLIAVRDAPKKVTH